jgi:carbamoyltransferase
MNILGISAFYHDSAAALLKDGAIIAAAQEERFTRKKHDHRFPMHAIRSCLEQGGIGTRDLNLVAFYDKPFLKFERILETYYALAPRGLLSFMKAMPLWMKQKLWMKALIQKELSYDGKIIFPEHHESHAASAFYPSPFARSAFLTMDGVGEWATASYGVGKGHELSLHAEIPFPHSLGLLYSAFTYYLGFKVNSGEYKVMGLAPYGEPIYKDVILSRLVDVKNDGSFRMNMEYFNYCAGLTMTGKKFHDLFGGPPRVPESKLTQRHMDIARSLQEVTEDIMVRSARYVANETGEKYLCLAGGVALNCVANGRILRERIFDDIWIQPAAGDAGGALGAALIAWHQYLGKPRSVSGRGDSQQGSYLGPSFSDSQIKEFLEERNIPFTELNYEELPGRIADLITQGKIIGWFEGRMEFGPRSLGARSIIGDARNPEMQRTMNVKIKFRESFRPFAPAVLFERAADYFDIDRPSPYMLLVAPVRKERRKALSADEEKKKGFERVNVIRSDIPAVTHVDYSARLQTVHRDTNKLFYDTIAELEKRTGCAVIINTSFNVRGEPIVCTPEDAFRCFMRTNIDYLAMGKYLLDKKAQKPQEPDMSWQKEYELD